MKTARPLLSLLVLMVLTIYSCQNKSLSAVEGEASEVAEVKERTEREMLEALFLKATVDFQRDAEEQCQYTFVTETGQRFEVMDFPKEYAKKDAEVWVQLSPQRRMSRCPGAQPASLGEIEWR